MCELHAFIARGTDAGIWGLTPRLDSPDTRVVVFLLSLEVMLKLGFGLQTRWWRSVFPAYAGVFRIFSKPRLHFLGLPRIRGGVPHLYAGTGVDQIVFPAYAGVFPLRGCHRWLAPQSSPHTRGCSAGSLLTRAAAASSPHMRGVFLGQVLSR